MIIMCELGIHWIKKKNEEEEEMPRLPVYDM